MFSEIAERQLTKIGDSEEMNPFHIIYLAISVLGIYLFVRLCFFFKDKKRLRVPSHNVSNVSYPFLKGESHD
ncbi:hypothetical protein [Leptospira idonii]|uniref:Uncharacterized protein n=1 Tax=Leptospira idonii TaxID=1193500 RepID=A0A4R9M1Y6_9LEPT|nr:hypothetical protein [Leptospira idonii]TGN20794.1 hypothetical protein EHS15_01795 [Leptospira idonii]